MADRPTLRLLAGGGGEQVPHVRSAPDVVRGFRLRLELDEAQPPIWRLLDLPGDLTLARLHDVIQVAMGWTDSHLHRFRTGEDRYTPHFVSRNDVEEGEQGLLEDDVRLDQLFDREGDELWYEYDFGDGWDHRLLVEAVHEGTPGRSGCLAGQGACPPEDCGGMPGYEELAAWVRGGRTDALLPEVFENRAHALDWLGQDWDPDRFDLAHADSVVADAVAGPARVVEELAELADRLERRGISLLRQVLSRRASHEPAQVSDDEAARLTETYRILLEVIGDGVTLTAAGYLPPAVVEKIAVRTGVTSWWIGKANREDLTLPVLDIRTTARDLGLVCVRKGRLSPTAAARRCEGDPQRLWRHIVSRLPLSTKDFEREAGWMALAVAGSGTPAEDWRGEVSALLLLLGWRSGSDRFAAPPAESSTLEVLEQLAGIAGARRRGIRGVDQALAATARAATSTSS